MAKHQSSIPPLAYRYFSTIPDVLPGYSEPVLISQTFTTERGWKRYPVRKRVSLSELRKLRKAGATHVQLSCHGRSPDFAIADLLKSAR